MNLPAPAITPVAHAYVAELATAARIFLADFAEIAAAHLSGFKLPQTPERQALSRAHGLCMHIEPLARAYLDYVEGPFQATPWLPDYDQTHWAKWIWDNVAATEAGDPAFSADQTGLDLLRPMLAKLPSAERIDHIRRELNAAWKIQNAKHRARDDAARAVSERALKVDKGRAKRGRLIVELGEAWRHLDLPAAGLPLDRRPEVLSVNGVVTLANGERWPLVTLYGYGRLAYDGLNAIKLPSAKLEAAMRVAMQVSHDQHR